MSQAVTIEQIKALLNELEVKIDKRFDGIDSRFDGLEKKIDYEFSIVDQRVKGVQADLDIFKEKSLSNQDTMAEILDRIKGEVVINKEHHRRLEVRVSKLELAN